MRERLRLVILSLQLVRPNLHLIRLSLQFVHYRLIASRVTTKGQGNPWTHVAKQAGNKHRNKVTRPYDVVG
jgi:hypothetical protein